MKPAAHGTVARGQTRPPASVVIGTELVSFSNLMTLRHVGIKPVAMIKIEGGTTHFAGWIQP